MPDFKTEIRARLTTLQLSPAREGEIVDELSQHLEDEYEQALSRGVADPRPGRGSRARRFLSSARDRELV